MLWPVRRARVKTWRFWCKDQDHDTSDIVTVSQWNYNRFWRRSLRSVRKYICSAILKVRASLSKVFDKIFVQPSSSARITDSLFTKLNWRILEILQMLNLLWIISEINRYHREFHLEISSREPTVSSGACDFKSFELIFQLNNTQII